jgi:hypothetical protein
MHLVRYSIVLVVITLLGSCSVQPRRHLAGLHIERIGSKPELMPLQPSHYVSQRVSLSTEVTTPLQVALAEPLELTADALHVRPLLRSSNERPIWKEHSPVALSDSVQCDTLILESGERKICEIIRVRSGKVFYKNCFQRLGPTSSIPRSMVASMVYANGRDDKGSAPRMKVEALGIVGLVFAIIALICLIFLLGYIPLVAIGLLGHLALILGMVSIINTYKHRDRYRLKALGILSLGLGYIIAIFSMLFLLL